MTDETPAFRFTPEDPAAAEIAALVREAEAHSARLYPAESNHHMPLDALRGGDVRFFVARDEDGRACGIGAVALRGDWAEVKSMWVAEDARRLGIAGGILDRLLAVATEAGVDVVRLETGVASHAAIALYESFGFRRRAPFADYRDDRSSVFMERRLDRDRRD